MKSFSSILSWLLMAAVLAVPSFLFYNWWSKGKQKASAEISQSPVTTNVFPTEPSSPGAQPAPAAPAAPADVQPAPSASAEAPAVPVAAQPAQAEPGPMDDKPEEGRPAPAQPASAATPAAGEEGEAGTGSEEGESEVQVSTETKPLSYYAPKGDRDPTLSPEDYRRIREAKLQREEAERMRRQAAAQARNKREPGPETKISLQGIIGQSAIVNGEMYNVGQRVNGIKILKIGTDYIICEYKGKKFRKVMR